MKKKNFLMLAFAAVAFAACSNEDLVPTGNPGDDNQLVTDPTGDAWVALAVKTPVQTRGLHNPNQEAATEDESKSLQCVPYSLRQMRMRMLQL